MEYTRHSVAGLVILYNSKRQVIDNIKSYIDQVDRLIVIDNSEMLNSELTDQVKAIANVRYLSNSTNLGVAQALNQGAGIAIESGYDFLLTMDDDTYFPEHGVQNMLDFLNKNNNTKVGIVGSQADPKLFSDNINSVPYTITSGNLLSLSAYKECGRFLDELFIDFVDHEYCFRLRKNGYSIHEINYVKLNHNLGTQKQLTFFKKKIPIYWTSHNPLRIYYKTRNCIFSLRQYTVVELKVKIVFYKAILKDLLKIIFFEDKKIIRFRLFARGVYDGLVGNLGKKFFNF